MAQQHPFHLHREHQVSHRRVDHILRGEPDGAKEHAKGRAFSKVTSKSGAERHDAFVGGAKSPKRYARGGKVKGHHTTNIVIANRPGASPAPPLPGPLAGPGGPPGAAGPAPSPMAGPSGMPPPGMPPGMPMRAKGGRVKDGESDKADLKKWATRAKDNSYFRGGAATGVGREEKAAQMKRRK